MIEVSVRLSCGPACLSGQPVECAVAFTRLPQPEHRISQSHSDVVERLAWASAQIHCFRSTKRDEGRTSGGGSFTSLHSTHDTLGRIVLQTDPTILFCDLALRVGESRRFVYRERLPMEAPPSYRGQNVKYSYKITVSTQRVNSPIKMIRIPLRVLSVGSITDSHDVSGLCCNETTEELRPANPFLEERKVETPLNIALKVLQNITARRNPNFYVISNARGRVARFCLFKSAYRMGEDIVGTFDFSSGTVKCVQVSVALQSEEVIKSEGVPNDSDTSVKAVTVARYHEMTLGLSRSQLILTIPLHITPAFETDIVSLRWKLHFEFVTSTCEQLNLPAGTCDWNAPMNVPIETMVWNLPIKIYPTLPRQIPSFCQSNNNCTLIIK